MAPVAPLFQPYKLGPFELKHRLVYAPLTRGRSIGNIPQPNAQIYYSQRASDGGLMISEGTVVAPEGFGFPQTPGIFTDEQVQAWQPVTQAVRDKGAVFFCQLWHVGRASHTAYQPGGAAPLSSSARGVSSGAVYLPDYSTVPYSTPRALSREEIPALVDRFRVGARNALRAGFDGVEIHGANGYVIDQFLVDNINDRTDEYGGSIANRCRLALEVVEAVCNEIGAERVGIRLSPWANFQEALDSNPVALHTHLVQELNKFNLAYVHIVEPRIMGNTTREVTDGASVAPLRAAYNGTLVAAGGFTAETAAETVEKNEADLVAFGRWWLANPDLPERFQQGASLNKYNRDTFYTPGQIEGYIDYPFLDGSSHIPAHAVDDRQPAVARA